MYKNMEFVYNEAIARLVDLGHDEDAVLGAILRNGHCYGNMDALSNIFHNTLAYLNRDRGGNSTSNANNNSSSNNNNNNNNNNSTSFEDSEPPVFTDLRQLREYSLAGMVCLLQQVRPTLRKGDAIWCLLMCDLHVGRASTLEIPVLPPPPPLCDGCGSRHDSDDLCDTGVYPPEQLSPALCKFHSGWGFANGDTESVPVKDFLSQNKKFNLTPTIKSLLKSDANNRMLAADLQPSSKQITMQQSLACPSSLSGGDDVLPGNGDPVVSAEGSTEPSEQEAQNANGLEGEAVNTVLSKFQDLNLDENLEDVGEDQKDEIFLNLIHQVKDLEKQVKERKDWAQQKAMQAARKLSNDLTELKMLRMEREETQRLKKGKQALEDTTMKRLSEMENALRKASSQVDCANAAVRRLETENAEIRAEMEASKLSAAESVSTCLEVAKREKKCLKRLLAWEKLKAKLQEEIAEEKREISELQQQLVQIEKARKDAEVKWKQELKARELAQAQVEEERHSKEAAEVSNKRRHEALRMKIEIDFQRHKDDIQRLEQELSRLKVSAQANEPYNPHNPANALTNSEEGRAPRETIARMLHELEELEVSSEKEASCERECLLCKKDEVCVVFLPCAHQVLCANCSDSYGKKGKAACPCCRVPIEQRIRVFGASSQ